MKNTSLILTFLLTLTIGSLACPKKFDPNPNKWMMVKQPDKNDRKSYNNFYLLANYSEYEWSVHIEENQIKADLGNSTRIKKENTPSFNTSLKLETSRSASAHLCLKVSNGWIIAYNEGEFGAAVYWFSTDGKEKKWLSDHHVNEFLVEGNQIFAVEGLAHMGSNRGSVIEILSDKDTKGNWKVTEFFQLPESADGIARVEKGDYVVVTTSMVLRFNLKKEILIILMSEGFGGLYSNSIAVDGKFIYIGMRQYVARLPLSKSLQKFDLLVPDKSYINTNPDPFGDSDE